MEFKTGEYSHAISRCGEVSAVPDSIGQTALFYAVQRLSDAEARELTERLVTVANLDPTRKDFGGQSPLFYAAACGNLETVKLLILQYGCLADERDNLLQSPLFYAARDGRMAVVSFLLDQPGVDCMQVDRNGQTPLFYAARENKMEICELLLNRAADPTVLVDHRDIAGRTASYFSRMGDHVALTEYLESKSGGLEAETSSRKRYRLVVVSSDAHTGSLQYHTPSVAQLEFLEKKYPDICVWSKNGPVVTGLVTGMPPVLQMKKKKSQGGIPVLPKPVPPVWVTVARQIVSDIFKKQDAWIFLRPVDPVKDQCSDYLKVIASPMDFATIRKKMSKYTRKQEFLDDVELVFANCKIYNRPGTLPDILCQRVESFYRNLIDQLNFTALPDSTAGAAVDITGATVEGNTTKDQQDD